MNQTAVQLRAPLLVYVDANPLVYWILPKSYDPNPKRGQAEYNRLRQETQGLFEVFGRHRKPGDQIIVVTSQWALTEVHSILYQHRLWDNKVVTRRNFPGISKRDFQKWMLDPRRAFPPDAASLRQATQMLKNDMQKLSTVVHLRIDQPDIRVWETALQLGQECGIYAPDCLHLATALYRGCDLLVTQDIGFLNLAHRFLNGVISQILQSEFGHANFQAYPLSPSRRLQNGVPTARQYLAQLGYT